MADQPSGARALVISPNVPWPVENGFQAKLAGFLEVLPMPWDLISGGHLLDHPADAGGEVHTVPPSAARLRPLSAARRRVLPACLPLPVEPVLELVAELLGRGRHYTIVHLDTLGSTHLAAPLKQLTTEFGQEPHVISSINDSYSLLLRSFPGVRARAHARLALTFERRYLPQSDVVDVVSDRDATWLTGTVHGASVRLIPLGIRVHDHAGPRLPPEWDMLYVGAGGMGRGPWVRELLNDVIPEVLLAAPDSRFAVAGSGETATLRKRVEHLGGRCLGFVPDLSRLIRSSRMVLVPSAQRSGTPTKALQAMACGVPVVGREQLDGIPNSEDGVSVLRASDRQGFVARILAVLSNAEYGAAIGRRGRDLVARQHDWSTVLERYLELPTRRGERPTGLAGTDSTR